jgi:type I restriction enzyme, S subunit
MITDQRPYKEYKESGIPWLGKIPKHWKLERTKWHFSNNKKINSDYLDKNILSLTLRGVVNNDPNNPEGLVPKDYGTYQLFEKHDLVFKLIDLENLRTSRVGLVHENGIMSSAYVRLMPFNRDGVRFFYHQFYDLYRRGIFNQLGAGVRSTLGSADLLNLPIVVPESNEQLLIVQFIEYANRRFEWTIRLKKKLIALMNEQKQAIIHSTVTRGLNPDIPLKHSGIHWLGDIPEHWSIVRNMALFGQRVEPGVSDLPVLQVSLHSGITVEELDQFGRPKKLIADATKYKYVHHLDLAYNTMRMWQGAIGVVPFDGLVSPAYVVLKPREGVCPNFYNYFFRTGVYKQQINRYSTGIVSDRNRLYWDNFKQMPNILLPKEEQERIVALIEKETQSLDTAIAHTEREISLIQEYRTRLTADIVTGKLDVREAAAKLPEEPEEPKMADEDVSLAEDDIEDEDLE